MNAFTTAYIECALWSSTDDTGRPLDENYGVEDIHPDTLRDVQEDCAAFQRDHAEDVAADLARAGHDFWLTRNRHGAGFWDGDWPADVGRRLTETAHVYGSVDLYVGDDGLIH